MKRRLINKTFQLLFGKEIRWIPHSVDFELLKSIMCCNTCIIMREEKGQGDNMLTILESKFTVHIPLSGLLLFFARFVADYYMGVVI